MSDFLDIMLMPFLACLVLTGIHGYLGLHVLQRGILFVDLALAQIAALGAAAAVLFGFVLHSREAYFISLGFSMLGALLLSSIRARRPLISMEVVIGIVYAVSSAAVLLVLHFAPEGSEELKTLLVGHLLFVQPPELIQTCLIYLVVGVLHFIFRKQLWRISRSAPAGGSATRWEVLFYATFALVVTSSVEMAGVLLVFSFLVVPAACGVMLATSIKGRLLTAWALGTLTSVLGVAASYAWDLPTGAAVVCALGALFLVAYILAPAPAAPQLN